MKDLRVSTSRSPSLVHIRISALMPYSFVTVARVSASLSLVVSEAVKKARTYFKLSCPRAHVIRCSRRHVTSILFPRRISSAAVERVGLGMGMFFVILSTAGVVEKGAGGIPTIDVKFSSEQAMLRLPKHVRSVQTTRIGDNSHCRLIQEFVIACRPRSSPKREIGEEVMARERDVQVSNAIIRHEGRNHRLSQKIDMLRGGRIGSRTET
jgi:hypothetical protein